MTTVAEFTEPALIARIQQRLAAPPAWLTVGIGDDAAVVEPERNRVEVLTVDALVEGVHFDRRFTPADAIGHRALAVNLSDLAAMGATPRLALLSFALPAALSIADFDAIVAGLADLAATYRVTVAGGNLTRTPGPLTLDVTLIGTAKRRQVLTRAGARPGDEVYVSGTVGTARAGLEMLQARTGDAALGTAADAANDALTAWYLRPGPRVRLGQILGRTRAASACIDLSDGLADGLHRIAGELGIVVDAAALPILPAARAWFEQRGCDPVDAAVAGGDDYELLFTARPRSRRRLEAARRHGGVPFTRIGVCTAEPGVRLAYPDRHVSVGVGYDHFRPAGPGGPGDPQNR